MSLYTNIVQLGKKQRQRKYKKTFEITTRQKLNQNNYKQTVIKKKENNRETKPSLYSF